MASPGVNSSSPSPPAGDPVIHDPGYLGFFVCFNRGEFYEAHDMLEPLWLARRRRPDADFYKGLIQLAGAFVHLQKHSARQPRLQPAASLLRLARRHLTSYAPTHARCDVATALGIIREWEDALATGTAGDNPFDTRPAPQLTPPQP